MAAMHSAITRFNFFDTSNEIAHLPLMNSPITLRRSESKSRFRILHWAGLDAGDKQMLDHVRFTRELIKLRWRYPGLRGQGFRVVHVHDQIACSHLTAGWREKATT